MFNKKAVLAYIAILAKTTVEAAEDHSIFGGDWYSANKEKTGKDYKYTQSSFEWNIPKGHLENVGFATHFKPVKVKKGETISFTLGWKSDEYKVSGCEKTKGKPKFGANEYYKCFSNDEVVEPDRRVCKREVACPHNTGDFRMVLADSNDAKIKKSNFGSLDLDEITGPW